MTASSTSLATATRAPLTDFGRPSFARLTLVELRKTLDTRAGRWLLVVILLMAAAGLGYRVMNAADTAVSYEQFYGTALTAVQQVLPLLGVLAMTSEWTQRTALVTFTLVPQRGRVLAARLVASMLLTVAMTVLIGAASAAAAALGGILTDSAVLWGDVSERTVGAAAAFAVSMLMGAAIGALLQQTPAALAVYFVAPALIVTVAGELLDEAVRWVDVYAAIGRISELDLGGGALPTASALVLWIGLPLLAGILRSMRREVQ
jgi:hypothetical protein